MRSRNELVQLPHGAEPKPKSLLTVEVATQANRLGRMLVRS